MSIDLFRASPRGLVKNVRQQGMSLVEVMVGLVIGMIGILVVFQTMSVWGARTSTTMSGGDARTSGAIGMYYLEQDLAQAGLGFSHTAFAGRQFNPGCNVTGGSANFPLVAVDIDDGADGAPDIVTVLYASSSNPSVNFSDVGLFEDDKSGSGTTFSYQGHALRAADRVVLTTLSGGGACVLRQITNAHTQTALNKITLNAAPGFSQGNLLYFGDAPQRARWRVNAASLERTNTIFVAAAEASPQVADGVVDLQAQYGLLNGTWQAADPGDWGQVRAIRVAFLVRSKQFEKEAVTTVAPVWHTGNATATAFVMSDLGDGTSWQRYRYEVFERTIPLRNVIWGAQE